MYVYNKLLTKFESIEINITTNKYIFAANETEKNFVREKIVEGIENVKVN